jgi:hypothetical protein
MDSTHGPIRNAAETLLSTVTVSGWMLAATLTRATQDSGRPWWFRGPLKQASTPNDLVVGDVML